MKICLISGQKESRQCGITDYVKLLAQRIEKLGHQTEAYLINKDSEVLTDLPDADFYSIQFAPYAFGTKRFT